MISGECATEPEVSSAGRGNPYLRSVDTTDDLIERVLELRALAFTPSEIAVRTRLPVEHVREVLDEAGVLGSRPATAPGIGARVAVACDLVDLVTASERFGVGRDTIRRWVAVDGLPYRDALGQLTMEPFSSRWCSFSVAETERWLGRESQ